MKRHAPWLAIAAVTALAALLGHVLIAAAIPVLAVAVRLGWAALIPSRLLPKDRIRRMHIRLRCQVIPGRGFVTSWGIRRKFSARAIVRLHGPRIRPSMTCAEMLKNPDSCSFDLGRAHLRQKIRLPYSEHITVIAPPRQGKSGAIGDVALDYPGAGLFTSTRDDLFRNTSGIRAGRGPVATFNPQRIGHTPSTIRVNPVKGCASETVAIRRATAFAEACSGKGTEDQGFWEQTAVAALAGLLCAADIVHADLRLVQSWGLGMAGQAVAILEAAGKRAMALALYEFAFSPADKTVSTIRMVLSESFGFMRDPNLAECVLPADGEGFDFGEFIRANGTLYLIGESDGKTAPVAGLFAFMAAEWKHAAIQLGSRMPGGRLDPPTGLFLDEAAAICPLPLPTMLQDSGGKGVQIFSVAHGLAQLEGRWKEHGRRTIIDTSNILVLPGIKDPELLKLIEDLCGTVLLKDRGDDGRWHSHPLVTAAMVRELPDWHGLLIRNGERPVIVRLSMSWQARAYKRAVATGTDVAQLTVPASAPMIGADTTWGELMARATRELPPDATVADVIRATTGKEIPVPEPARTPMRRRYGPVNDDQEHDQPGLEVSSSD